MFTNKHIIEDFTKDDIQKLEYAPIDEKDKWKVNFIREITDIKFNKLIVEDFSTEELFGAFWSIFFFYIIFEPM